MRKKEPLQRTDLMDTSPAAHRRQIELLRRMSPEEKIRLTFAMMEDMRRVTEAVDGQGLLGSRR